MTVKQLLLVSSLYLVLALIILIAVPTCSIAGEYVHPIYEHTGYQQPQRTRRVRRHVRREPRYDRETVRLYRSMDDEYANCGPVIRGLGTQWIGTEGALEAAKKDWMERTRYDLGEAYLDLTNAKDFVSRCGRVSVGETMGQVMYRCDIRATPCKPKFTEGQQVKK
jgi:hypothetical protein